MKRIYAFFLPAFLLLLFSNASAQQERCGFDLVLGGMDAKSRAIVEAQYAVQLQVANAAIINKALQYKTTGSAPVPVVFHYLITEREREVLGGDTGIIGRVHRQLQVLNEDFNAGNADQVNVPVPFKSRFGNAGIRFGLAGRTSAYTIAKGIEIRELSSTAGYDFTTGFQDAKRFSEGGLDGWDHTKYLNVWVFNTGDKLLGLAIPASLKGFNFGGHILSGIDVGVVVNYRALGKRQSIFNSYIPGNDLGRTLTHEVGHFFDLRHIWGNTTGSCSIDDGIADTPPQFEATYCNDTTCPSFPIYDMCSPAGNGIMFMNFMDYVVDSAMNMFTQNQVRLMQSLVAPGGPLVSLTDNPSLSVADAGLAGNAQNTLRLFPNPATTQLFVESPAGGKITNFTLSDVTGREVFRAAQLTQNTISLAGYARGLYFVRGTVAGQPFAGKVVVE